MSRIHAMELNRLRGMWDRVERGITPRAEVPREIAEIERWRRCALARHFAQYGRTLLRPAEA